MTGEGDAQQKQSDPSSGDFLMTEVHEEVSLTGEGVSQEEQCDPSSGDLPMTYARPANPVDTRVTEEPSNPSPTGVTAVVPFILPPPTTQPEETPQSTLESTCMNDDVVDDTMRDLDPFSPPPKDLVLCPHPLPIREVIESLTLIQCPEIAMSMVKTLTLMSPTSTLTRIHYLNGGRGSRDCDGLLMLVLTSVLHRPPLIHKVRTRKAQAPQEGAGRALAGKIRRDPLWLDRSNPAELISRNR